MDSLRVEVGDESGREADVSSSSSSSIDEFPYEELPPYAAEEYVVDMQGFTRSTNIFVFKEVAIMSLNKNEPAKVYLFTPPCKWNKLFEEEKRLNQWNLNYHGIPWESGTVPYNKRIEVIQNSLKDADVIYVKGLQKKNWIEEIVPER